MQINELEISRKLKRGMVGADLANLLTQKGWTPLGFGFEAGVAEHPRKSYVLKIFPKSSPYVHFVSMVQSHPQNPHFPRFSRYVRPVPGTEYAYVRMEKLTKMLPYDLTQFPSLLCLIDEMWFTHIPHAQPPYWVRSTVSWDPHVADSNGVTDCNQVSINPQEKQAIQMLSNTLKEIGSDHIDLHAGNFMMRGNTWVITDPFI
jgi:hypothetical protein